MIDRQNRNIVGNRLVKSDYPWRSADKNGDIPGDWPTNTDDPSTIGRINADDLSAIGG